MAALTAVNPKVVSGPVMETATLIIKNGQSWKAGEFLNVDSYGLNVCLTDDDASTGGIKYLALEDQDDPVATTTTAEVGVIDEDHVFEGNELDGQLTALNIGANYAINVASNVVTVDVGDTTNPAVQVTDIGQIFNPALYNATDTKQKVRFKILTTCLQAAPA